MAIEVQAPHNYQQHPQLKIFLGGSIEMGKAADWQQQLISDLSDLDVVFLNPRRTQWDNSWEQTMEDPRFVEQVEWELDGLDNADIVVLYFDPETKAPISLLELGLHINDKVILVCCPKGFYRRGNVEIVCRRYDVPLVPTLNALKRAIKIAVDAILNVQAITEL